MEKTKLGSALLTRRPVEGATTQQMQMQMEDGLASAASSVNYRAVALRKVTLTGQFGSHQLQLAQHRLVFRSSLIQRSKMFLRERARLCCGMCR